MTQKSYAVEYRRQGIAGGQELFIRVYNASTGDNVCLAQDFARIESAAIVARSNGVIQISVLTVSLLGALVANVCLPAGASLAGDDFDMILVGPALASVA